MLRAAGLPAVLATVSLLLFQMANDETVQSQLALESLDYLTLGELLAQSTRSPLVSQLA